MNDPADVVVIVGSLRKASFNRRVADGLAELAPDSLALEQVPIGDLPLYNQDFDEDSPAPYRAFRERIERADAVLFVTPEHNRSMPAALKNALDVASRPYGSNVWAGKPAGVVSASVSAQGGFGANHHLRQSLTFLDMPVLQQPEVYLGKIDGLLAEGGGFAREDTRTFLSGFMQRFAEWIRRLAD